MEQTLYLDAKSIGDYIWKTFDEKYSVRGVTELLKRLGYVYKKPKIIPGKADPEAQKEFLRQYEELKSKLKPDDKILFMDGVHSQHNTIAAYGWIKKGKEKEIKSNTGRQRLNINGALELDNHKVTVTFEETLNAITVLSLFKKLRKIYKKAGKLYIICDNAKYYKKVRPNQTFFSSPGSSSSSSSSINSILSSSSNSDTSKSSISSPTLSSISNNNSSTTCSVMSSHS